MSIVCTIDATGISAPDLATVRAYFVSGFQGVYGADIYLEPDSQDGQMIGLFATAVSDVNASTIAAYNSYSPSTAQGNGLSSNVKINGLTRAVATYSSVDLLLGGTAGTTITGGYATDTAGVKWMLPASVTIPSAGQITVTATSATIGDVSAVPNSIAGIGTPTRGWQTVTNLSAAVEGAPVEVDGTLRQRQARSTALPSSSILQGIEGAILKVTGVTSCKGYENDTNSTDGNGIPGHTISMVVEGGDATTIAGIIYRKKGPGTGTYGSTSEVIVDALSGIPATIRFQRPAEVPITVEVHLTALVGYTTAVGEQIQAAVAAYINSLSDGDDVYIGRVWTPANLSNGANSSTYALSSVLIARDAGSPAASNVVIGYAERATCVVGDIDLVVA